MTEPQASDLLKRTILSVDTYQGTIVALRLDDGAYLCLDAKRLEIYRPKRRCHGCDRAIDSHSPDRIVYCGRCGEP